MARKNEVKENEELKQEVAQVEATQETPEKVENIEAPEQDAKVEENASNEKQDAEVQVTKEEDKLPTVKEIFRDKYDEKVVYNPGDVFIESDELEDKKPVKVEKGKYKVSKERYEEIKRSLYVD